MIKPYYHLHPDGQRIGLAEGEKLIIALNIPTLESQIKEMDLNYDCVPLMGKEAHIKATSELQINNLS